MAKTDRYSMRRMIEKVGKNLSPFQVDRIMNILEPLFRRADQGIYWVSSTPHWRHTVNALNAVCTIQCTGTICVSTLRPFQKPEWMSASSFEENLKKSWGHEGLARYYKSGLERDSRTNYTIAEHENISNETRRCLFNPLKEAIERMFKPGVPIGIWTSYYDLICDNVWRIIITWLGFAINQKPEANICEDLVRCLDETVPLFYVTEEKSGLWLIAGSF